MTTPRAALAALLQALPTCQYDDDARGNPRPHCRALATVGTVSHQPTHCAEHAELLGRGVVGTRTADWADDVEQAERALAAADVGPVEPRQELAKALGIHTGITWEEALIAVAAQRELAERPVPRRPPCSEEYVRLRELAIRTPYSVAELIDELEAINRWRIEREPATEGTLEALGAKVVRR